MFIHQKRELSPRQHERVKNVSGMWLWKEAARMSGRQIFIVVSAEIKMEDFRVRSPQTINFLQFSTLGQALFC